MASIRLSKTNKTIRLANKDGSIRLSRDNKTIKVVNRKENIRLLHTGKTGPVGATGISTFVRVHHQNDPTIARPNAQFVEWVGTVAPNNGTTEDTWIDTA